MQDNQNTSPQPMQSPPVLGPTPSAPISPQPPAPNKKIMYIIGAVIAVAVIAVLAIFVVPALLTKKTNMAAQSAVAGLPSASDLTADKVASLNKDDIFWGYFKNAAMQQRILTTHVQVQILDPKKPADTITSYIRNGFDYQTKKGVFALDESRDGGKTLDYKTRCIDGKRFSGSIDGPTTTWSEDTKFGPDYCMPSNLAQFNTDGVNAGGLTAAQADTFIKLLRDQKGLFTVSKLTLDDHKGKKYLHFVADITPIATTGEFAGTDVYQGIQWLDYAFNKTNLAADEHPYAVKFGFGNGFHIDYYVDPATQLPAYTEVSDTPFKKDDGSLADSLGNVTLSTLFDFSKASFDASTTNNAPITLDW